MPPSTTREAVSMCCTNGAGFVLHPAGPDGSAEHVVPASLATRIAHHTAEWLLDHGIENTGFCVRAAVSRCSDGSCQNEIAIEADLTAIALDEQSCEGLARYVEPRARSPQRPSHPIRWSWRMA